MLIITLVICTILAIILFRVGNAAMNHAKGVHPAPKVRAQQTRAQKKAASRKKAARQAQRDPINVFLAEDARTQALMRDTDVLFARISVKHSVPKKVTAKRIRQR